MGAPSCLPCVSIANMISARTSSLIIFASVGVHGLNVSQHTTAKTPGPESRFLAANATKFKETKSGVNDTLPVSDCLQKCENKSEEEKATCASRCGGGSSSQDGL